MRRYYPSQASCQIHVVELDDYDIDHIQEAIDAESDDDAVLWDDDNNGQDFPLPKKNK